MWIVLISMVNVHTNFEKVRPKPCHMNKMHVGPTDRQTDDMSKPNIPPLFKGYNLNNKFPNRTRKGSIFTILICYDSRLIGNDQQ